MSKTVPFKERMKVDPDREREKAAYELGMKAGYSDGIGVRTDALLYVLNRINTPFVSRSRVIYLATEAVRVGNEQEVSV